MAKKRRPKTEEEKRRARNERLKRLYGITIKEYEERLAQQNGCCAICLKPPATVALSVDHDHKWKYLKLSVEEGIVGIGFVARVKKDEVLPSSPYHLLCGIGNTKNGAKSALRDRMRRASVRGLLCFSCNGGLRKYRDTPDILRRAAEYLSSHQGR